MELAGFPLDQQRPWCSLVTERTGEPYGDPTSEPFWKAAARHQLLIQKCRRCGAYQFYPRPICVACLSEGIEWVTAVGTGRIYSMTTVRRQTLPDFPVPYVNAIVELDEGPRLLTTIVGDGCAIGDRVRLVWKDRPSAPPLPLFERID
jgi:uncharacterized protein